ncbi:uncharacterized protein TM35_000391810 [Trypanosoma theileri]|uniref:C3H1-type domain-containing protein n=1 Tax=Trypanosoma theileri TaxID=67003 RepID=A0A1X0NK26_9TRYP|nr:uncharacterized protein TM35_000391810 [Trypanosoma theileri]ORC85007.1 hypothetical protein TM35_000391810 [Trypanosoma theileri]
MAQLNSISIGLQRESHQQPTASSSSSQQQQQQQQEEETINSNSAFFGGAGSNNETTPRETPMGAVVRHGSRFETSCTPLSHQQMQGQEEENDEERERTDSVDLGSTTTSGVYAGRSQTGQGSALIELQRRRSSCMSIGMMDDQNVDISRGKNDVNTNTIANNNTNNNNTNNNNTNNNNTNNNNTNNTNTVVTGRKNSQNQVQYVNKNSDTPQRDRLTHRHSVEITFGNRTNSPLDRTLSPVSWRHNPYTLTPTSPTTDSVNAGNRQSPCITAHNSLASNSLTVAIKTNPAVRNSPTALRVTSNAAASCMGSGFGASSHDYARAFMSTDAVAHGVGGDEEDEFCRPPSSTLSMYEGVSLESQGHMQSHLQSQSAWPTRNRANSAFCATQRGRFSPSLSACAAASLCTSPSCEARQRSFSLHSTRSSPMMRPGFAEPAGPLFTPSTSHWGSLQSPATAFLDEGGSTMNTHNNNNNNNNQPQHHSVNSGIYRRCSTGSLSSPSCFVHNIVPTFISPLPAATGSTPAGMPTVSNTSGAGMFDNNTNSNRNSTSCPHSSPQHAEMHSNSPVSLKSWSTTQTSSQTPFRRGDAHNDTYDREHDGEMHVDDEENDIEPYNATLRPNDVSGAFQEGQLDALSAKLKREHSQGNNSAAKMHCTMKVNNDMRTGPLTVLHPLPRPPSRRSSSLSSSSSPQRQREQGQQEQEERGNEREGVGKEKKEQHTSEEMGMKEEQQQQQQAQQQQQQQEEQAVMVPVISAIKLEEMMFKNPKEEVMCPEGFHFSVYDADIREHYMIESSNIVATRGAVRYVAFQEQYTTHSRFRFQLCKRYINGRCTQKMDCQYIHSHHIPSCTLVHVNENVISSAAIGGREFSAEVLRGGKNTHGYATLPPGVILHVYPPNQEKSVPQLIPSEMILQTVGASNVHSLLIHFATKSTNDDNGVSSNNNNNNNNNDNNREGDTTTTTTADTPNAPTNDTMNTGGIRARHCAHFQFNKMCNLGSSCHFIHSLVPYVQGLTCLPQDTTTTTTTAAAFTTAMITPHPGLPPNAASHHGLYPAAGGGIPSYPVEVLHPHPQPQQTPQAVPTNTTTPTTTAVTNPIAYHTNVHMAQIPVYMQPSMHPQWNAYNYGGNYPPAEYAVSTGPALNCLSQQHETLTVMPPHGQYFAQQY